MSIRWKIAARRGVLLAGCLLCVWGLASASRAPAQVKKGTTAPPPPVKTGKDYKGYDILVNSQGAEQVAYLNEMLEKGWQDNKIDPSDRASDYEFIRRASLDIIGRIAKPHEIKQFEKDPPRERRGLLIERLLASEEYAQNFATVHTVHLLTRSGSSRLAQDQLRDWLADKLTEQRESPKSKTFSYVPDWSKIVTDLIAATGKTNENAAVNFVLHHMGEAVTQDREANGAFDMVPLTSRTTRLFLGLRTQCVQCHDHPFNGEWGQHHFWGINAFFRQTDAPGGRPTMMQKKKQKGEIARQFELVDNPSYNRKGLVFYERRNTLVLPTDPTFLSGKKLSSLKEKDGSRRMALAKFIVNDPHFAKVSVNRMWGHFFGKSFTKENADDFGEHNPISNPELLDKLADDWAKKYAHNPKDLIRWICNSRAYGLSSIANKTNDKPEDEVLFSRMLLKSMSPEQLFESLMVATQSKVAESKESRSELKEEWLRKLIVSFGDDEGNEISYNGTVIQALMLMNGQDINNAIMDKDNGTVAAILKKRAFSPTAAKDAMTDIYLAALNRPPTPAETARLLSPKVYNFRPEFQKTVRDQQAFWTGFYQDMMWAVLNSNEFILNH